jgi:hypothetical protein
MKLNPDCIRDILLSIEKNTDSMQFFSYTKYSNCHEHLLAYTHNEILYHLYQCDMAELITGFEPIDDGDSVKIRFLTPKGHEFLENIRSDTIWKKTKKILEILGVSGLGSIEQIARSLLTELIKLHLNII